MPFITEHGHEEFGHNVGLQDDQSFVLGTNDDIVIHHRSTTLAADAELTNVIEGTSDHQGIAANSLIISNITDDGDVLMLVSDGGHSKEYLLANGDTADLQLGHGMATATVKTASGNLPFSPGGNLILHNGLNFIGDTTNANMSIGLTINQAETNHILALKSSDVTHPITATAEADTFGSFKKAVPTGGGLKIEGTSDTEATLGANTLQLVGSAGDATLDTTDTSASTSVISIVARKTNGSTGTAVAAATENMFSFQNNGTVTWLQKGNGAIHQTTDAHTALDDYPDFAVGRAGRQVVAKGNLEGAGRFVDPKLADILEERDIIHFNRETDGRAFVNTLEATFFAWDMGFQLGEWINEITKVLTPTQKEQLPSSMRQHLAALEVV